MPRSAILVVWLASLGVTLGLGALLYELLQTPAAAELPAGESLEPSTTTERSLNPYALWTVTEQLSAHHVLVAHVETGRPDQALTIAKEIARPVKHLYSEVIIYFHRPGRPDTLPPRRVQWTPRGGWVEVNYEALDGR
ncbi:MAG: hypothetical protein AB1635_16400 [Acidobacteriota bacterium]